MDMRKLRKVRTWSQSSVKDDSISASDDADSDRKGLLKNRYYFFNGKRKFPYN